MFKINKVATNLATSAFVDIVLGSGYYRLKDSLKATMSKCKERLITLLLYNVSVKVVGEALIDSTSIRKFDNETQVQETNETNFEKVNK